MSKYYPQCAVTFRIIFEDFSTKKDPLDEQHQFTAIPRSCEVEINDYTEADSFKLTLPYKDFPFDPRTIRAVGVTIHIEDMESIFDKRGIQKKLIPSEENTVFIGFADESTIVFDKENRTVEMEGRDFTALLIDQKYFGGPVNMSLPLIKIIEDLIFQVKSMDKIEIVNRTGADLPSPQLLTLDLEKLGNKKNQKKGDTYWDVIQEILFRLGLVGYMEKDKFIIDRPRNAFIGRKGYTQFVYGLNLSSLKFKRKIGRLKGINIKVVGLDQESKKTIVALIPKEATDPDLAKLGEQTVPVINADGTKGDPKVAEYRTFKVSGIRDKAHLITKGEEIFYEYSRQQLEGSLSTREMLLPERIYNDGDPSAKITKVDFSKIKNGTPIEVFISQDDMERLKNISTVAQRYKYLRERFYSEDVANALARTMNKISTPFYTRNVRFMIDNDNGFKMDLDFINIIDLDNANLDI